MTTTLVLEFYLIFPNDASVVWTDLLKFIHVTYFSLKIYFTPLIKDVDVS